MNPNEAHVVKQLQSEGRTVRNSKDGMPDFFCYRTNPDGSTEIQFVEAKADDDPIRPNQELVISLLRQSGVTVKILRNTGFYEWFTADEGRRVQLTTLPGIPFREAQISYVKNPPKRSEDDL